MTVNELVEKIRIAQRRMSRRNPHRLLLMQCEDALIQLAVRVEEHSQPAQAENAPPPAA